MRNQLIDFIFSSGGALAKTLKNYEERQGQREMAHCVLESYETSKIALIEAGTGIGKSLAYLVPAVFWALKHQEKTVISTNTIALQEQLLHKDIPFLLEIMDVEVKACLVKGMSNYVCLRKLADLDEQPLLFSLDESEEVQQIQQWAETTTEGSRSGLPLAVTPATWEKVSAEGETCNHVHCPQYKKCFFFKARKEAEDAQILIVNHHLLLADVEARRSVEREQAILPHYQRVVIDEAHHLESIALESFAQRVDRISLIRQLSKVHSDHHPERARLGLIRKDLATLSQISPALLQKLEIDLPALRRDCQMSLDSAFAALTQFFENTTPDMGKKRISESDSAQPFWSETIIPGLKNLAEEVTRFCIGLNSLQKEIETIFKGTPLYEKLSSHLLEIQGVGNRLGVVSTFLETFVLEDKKEKRVRWMEMRGSNLSIFDASLDVSSYLYEYLFEKQRTSVLCSATMTTAESFLFLKQRLGLATYHQKLTEEIYSSPFNYQERALFVVPSDLPPPSSSDFLKASFDAIKEAIEISGGSVFVLFTSYDMLQKMHQLLSQTQLQNHYPFLKQGDSPRHLLLNEFKKLKKAVLFGTDSFWEGVDVPGDALRCVIITKLPFSVPTEPLYEAYTQALEKEGLNPFADYSVPQAVIKFKQGFGRLMRSKDDRGCVICLDNRIVSKNYGKQFLKSLPSCRTAFGPKSKVFDEMRSFMRYGA